MKRHIEFRAKRTDNGEWVEAECYNHYKGNGIWEDSPQNEIYFVGGYACFKETICEYTGLTDKNGNKIFEGDIVSIGELSAVKVCGCYVVKYNTKQARYGLFTADGAEQAGFNFDTMKSYNIIGNIYDNPELLLKAEQQ